jgi:hypothetical protein
MGTNAVPETLRVYRIDDSQLLNPSFRVVGGFVTDLNSSSSETAQRFGPCRVFGMPDA